MVGKGSPEVTGQTESPVHGMEGERGSDSGEKVKVQEHRRVVGTPAALGASEAAQPAARSPQRGRCTLAASAAAPDTRRFLQSFLPAPLAKKSGPRARGSTHSAAARATHSLEI